MGEPTTTIHKQKSHPLLCHIKLLVEQSENPMTGFPAIAHQRFPPAYSFQKLWMICTCENCWEVVLVDSERWFIHQKELGTEHATMCDLMPKTVPRLVCLFGKLISWTLGKQNQELKLPLNISSIQTKNQPNKPIVCFTCLVKASQLLMSNSWVPGEPVPE